MSVTPSTVGSPPPLRVRPSGHRLGITAFVIALTVCWSCSGNATDVLEDTLEREAFIGAYVDLRAEVLGSGTTEIQDDIRDSILAVYGVTGEELLEFVDLHGEDVEFMGDLWGEIEGLLTERLQQNARDVANDGLEDN